MQPGIAVVRATDHQDGDAPLTLHLLEQLAAAELQVRDERPERPPPLVDREVGFILGDAEARAPLAALLSALRNMGLVGVT